MKICFLGDCRLDGRYGESMLEVPGLFPEADRFVVNLETAVSDQTGQKMVKRHCIIAPYEMLCRVLDRFQGHLILNLANNHMEDAGEAAVAELGVWLAQRQIAFTGLGHAVRLNDGGKSIEIMGVASVAQGQLLATFDRQYMRNELLAMCARADFSIVLPHWGEEHVFFASPAQRRRARALAGMGVRAVMGSHPHVVQGLERINETMVAYSLGNAVFSVPGQPEEAKLGAAVLLDTAEAGNKMELIPLHIGTNGHLSRLPTAYTGWFERIVAEASNFPTASLWWYGAASTAFFGNHLGSWRIRIKQFGPYEVLKFFRACLSRTYLLMLLGWMMPVRGKDGNRRLAGQVQRLLADHGAAPVSMESAEGAPR